MGYFGHCTFSGTVFADQQIIAFNPVILQCAKNGHITEIGIGRANHENEASKVKNVVLYFDASREAALRPSRQWLSPYMDQK
jgi:hypothetical protein